MASKEDLFKFINARIGAFKNWFFKTSLKKKLIFAAVIITIVWFAGSRLLQSKQQEPQYETAKAEKGTLVISVSGSGTITSGNSTSVTTKVSGVVKKVYVTNGDAVTKGQKIAEVTPDDYAAERQTASWVSYLDAQEAVKTAEKNKVDADIQMWEDRQAVLDAEEEVKFKNNNVVDRNDEVWTESGKAIVDKTLDQAKKSLEVSELKYKNADSEIQAAKAKVASTWRDYQENSSTIYTPVAGIISDLALAPGIVINASSSTSSSTGATIVSAQTVGKISNPSGQLIATVTLTEIDIINIKANQKVTLTLDAYSDKTFTGKVLAVNTAGSVSSGVTSYPVSILLDPVSVDIYPNMAVNAQIITSFKDNVVLVPISAIQTINGQPSVQIIKDGQITAISVETGNANDSQTEIISGVNEGDEVVTATITSAGENESQNATTSPFSGLGRTTGGSSGRSSVIMREGGPPGGF